ncbi:MAG: cytochrome c [Anaerolineae bacterium]|nr:cytochrome c [Phycisphaerae bacterium]
MAVSALIAVDRFSFAQDASPPLSGTSGKAFRAVEDQKHLHNAYIVTDQVISGAQPDDDAAFQALRDLGVKTIISVDGAKPNAELAHRYGMRYIHLPIGYDDVPAERGKEIAKAIEEMPGPIYVHCHHGKHRSAAAVAVACVMSGQLKPEQAESVLKTFGTGANYTGLWKAARDARPVGQQSLKSLDVTYVEYTKLSELAASMVAVDQRFDHLKLAQKNGWRAPADHPDIDPPHEALQMQEHFHEMGRLDEIASRPADFRKWLVESDDASRSLHEALKASPISVQAADAAFNRVNTSCTACHKAYRD